MDKHLKQLKAQYHSDITTTFTDEDKQAVLNKIKQPENKSKTNVFRSYPKAAISVIAAAIFLLAIAIHIQQDFRMGSSNDEMADSAQSTEMSSLADTEENTLVQHDEESSSMDMAMEVIELRFDPDLILTGATFADMEVVEVNREEASTTITFKGVMWVNGTFQLDDDQLTFVPHESSGPTIPLAIGDELADVTFTIANEETARNKYSITDESSILESDQGYLLEVTAMNYTVSPEGSSVTFEIAEGME